MRTIHFGEGAAQTSIPKEWTAESTPQGVVVAPPNQDAAFLWLSTLSWRMPNDPLFSPATHALQSHQAKEGFRTEQQPDFLILYYVEEGSENGQELDIHQFEMAPVRMQNRCCIVALATLSVKREERESALVRQALQVALTAARQVTFNYEEIG